VCVSVADSDIEVPQSTSVVVLRVGARLQLRCTARVLSWSKDGVNLRDGFKYNIVDNLLTVRHTGTHSQITSIVFITLFLIFAVWKRGYHN